MVPVLEQIEAGQLVCPNTRQQLRLEGKRLVSADGCQDYQFEAGVADFLSPAESGAYLAEQGEVMAAEYLPARPRSSFLRRLDNLAAGLDGYRSAGATAAFDRVIATQPPSALCVSVGGGPTRAHENLVNVNIGRFANVEVVADAYQLPYADGAVDALHCEAVLEHLEFPERAVAEMYRALKPGGQVFAATPFLQAFHAYPNHFQNFTLEGHSRLFQRAGFKLVDSGACVGPTFMLADLYSLYLRSYLPGRSLARAAAKMTRLLARVVVPLDRRLLSHPAAALLASTVFCWGRKGA